MKPQPPAHNDNARDVTRSEGLERAVVCKGITQLLPRYNTAKLITATIGPIYDAFGTLHFK
jgi:hypothetical protein